MSSKITGYAMSPEEIPWLHDVFATVQDDFDERTRHHTYFNSCGGI